MVNGERYCAMLNKFLFPKIQEDDMDDIWFQQDWPPQSCGLTPLDYFLWGAVKVECYTNHPKTIEALKYEIEFAIHGIEAQTIENVLKNQVDRIGYCKANLGSHLNDIVFGS